LLEQDVVERLKKPLDHTRIKTRAGGGGMQLAYLKGHNIIDVANETFGFGGWGYDLLNVELVNVLDENGQVVGGYYAARVRLNVAGCVPITEEGINPIQEGRNPRARIDAHDMARKGAVTDAMKRAFRCFGDQFGNSLYDSEPGGDGDTRKTPPAQAASQPTQQRPNNQLPPPAPALRPVTVPTPIPVQTTTKLQPEPDLVSEKEIRSILALAGSKGLDEIDLSKKSIQLYKKPVDQLDLDEARKFYRVLQQV
jgi:DNA repair and recombination protein RAD52